MKKNLLSMFSIAIFTSVISAMDGKHSDDKAEVSTSVSAATPSSVTSEINAEELLSALKTDPNNVYNTGSIPGLNWLLGQKTITPQALEVALRGLVGLHNELSSQVRSMDPIVRNVGAVQQALEESQKVREKLILENEKLRSNFLAEQALVDSLKEKERNLLTTATRSGQEKALEQARAQVLSEQNESLSKLVEAYRANEAEIERLLKENLDREQSMPPLDPNDMVRIENVRKSIAAVIENNKRRIKELQDQNAQLERSKQETQARIRELEKAISANDFYTQLKKKILDRNTPDDDLALDIMSVMRLLGQNLDQISEGRGERLIEILINTSMPNAPRPSGNVQFTYEGRFRKLGNYFVAGELAWNGSPFDLSTCTYGNSQFATNNNRVLQLAKERLTGK